MGNEKKSEGFSAGQEEDLRLVSAALDGSYDAFEALVTRYQDKAYRLAWSLVKDDSDANDVVQDAFLNVYRKLDSYNGDAAFSSWIYRIIVNTALMKLRKQKRRSEVAMDALSPSFLDDGHHAFTVPEWQVRADEAVENKELREKILAAIDDLEPKYQTVFVLKEIEGLSLKEVGDIMDLTVPAVKSRLHRARLYLRASLERYVT
jgi:RNA polymerase sigma-70 factor (ECF subfamily)